MANNNRICALGIGKKLLIKKKDKKDTEFLVMSFWLCSALNTFVRLMETKIDLLTCLIYLNDILVSDCVIRKYFIKTLGMYLESLRSLDQ